MPVERGLTEPGKPEELEGPVVPAAAKPVVAALALGALSAEATAAAAQAAASAKLPPVGVVLPAGGQGLRAGGAEPKQFLPLRPGRPMLVYALEAFHRMDCVKQIVLVLPPGRLEAFGPLTSAYPKLKLAGGGAERWESVRNGVAVLDPRLPLVAVHDVARPFVSEALIRRCLEAAAPDACALAAMPASDTVKETAGPVVTRTLDRSRLVLAQTPQVFPRKALEAMQAADWSGRAPTDEASMAERLGWTVRWVRGSELNRKVTGSADLAWATWLAERMEAGTAFPDV